MLEVVAGANINVGVNAPVTITGNEATLLIPNSGTGNIAGDATITLNPAGNLALNGANGLSLTIDNSNGGHIGQSAKILLMLPIFPPVLSMLLSTIVTAARSDRLRRFC